MLKNVIKSVLVLGTIISAQQISNAQDKVIDQIVAVVGSNPILKSDIEINQQMDRRMNYFIENIGSEKEVEKYFSKSINMLKAEMSETIKEQLKTEQMQAKSLKR